MHPVAILGALALMGRSFVTAADPTCATGACTWSQNAPEDGFWCRLLGFHETATVYRESLDTHPLQRNNLECGAVCSVLPNCKSSTFSTHEGRCLFADKPGNYDFTTADAPDAWSDQTCFDCQCLTYTQPSTGPACNLPTCMTGEIESHVCFYPGNSFPASYTVPTSQYAQQDSFEACAAICLKLEGCKSSTWAGGNSCRFAKSSPNEAFWEGNGSDLFWSENECFICQCPAATTTTTSTQAASTPFGSTCNPASCARLTLGDTPYQCNVEGRIHQTSYNLNPDDFPQQNSFEDCAVLCHKTEGCMSSSFDGNYCLFANELPSSSFMMGDSYPVYWSENSCFNCPGCAARVVTTTTTSSTTSSTPSSSPPATCAIETCEWGNFAGNSLCGYGGGRHRTAYAADKTLYPHQSSFEECAAVCRKLPGCKSSVWSGNNDCLFANEEPNEAFLEWLGPNPSDLWWNSNTCFNCACPAVITTTSSTTTTSTTSTTTTQATSTGSVTCSDCALVDNFRDYTCFYMGTYHAKGYTVSRDQYPQQSDFETCNAVCRAVPGCKSSTWDGSNCLLANELPNESFQIVAGQNPSDLFWSETRCFSCDCTEVQPVTTTTTSTTTAPQATCSAPVCSLTIRDGNPDQCFYMGTEHRTAYRAPSQNKLPQNSYEECAAICLTLPGCKSSTMSWTGVCMFANEEPSEAFWDGQGNDLFWSPNRCFSCQCSDATSITTTTTPTPTPTPSPQNACNTPTCDFIPENPYMDKCYYMGTKHLTAYTAPYDTYPQQNTYELCAAICSKLPSCKSSTWAGGNRCYFANELPSEAFWDVPNNDWSGLSDMFWSDTRCFNCQCPGAQSVSTTTTTSTPTPTPSSPTGCDAPTCTWDNLENNRDKCFVMGNEYPRKAYKVSRDLFPEQNSHIECVVVCSKLPNCKTSSHNGIQCLLVDEVWNESFWEGDGSDTWWSDNSCINCQCPNVEPTTTTTTSTTTSPTSQAECQNIGCRRDYDASDNNLCHYRGTFTTAYETSVDTYPLQNDEDQCAAVCAQLPGCVFSAYSPQLGHCMFSNDETHYANFYPASIATGGIFWSQKQCYSCTACASLPPLPSTPVSHCKNVGCKLKPDSETQGKTCHYHGLYGYAYESWMNKRADSAVDCAGTCAQLRDCKASAWHPEYEICVFSNEDIGTGTWWSFPSERPEAAIDYYAQECFDCGPCPTEPVTPSDPVETPITPVETPGTPVNPVQTPTNPLTPVETPTETPGTGGTCNGDVTHHYGDYIACGISGQAGNQVQSYRLPNYVSVPVATLWECANICLGRPDCQGFDYHKYTYECKPYTTGVMNLGLTYIPTEWTRFYDRSCFRCA